MSPRRFVLNRLSVRLHLQMARSDCRTLTMHTLPILRLAICRKRLLDLSAESYVLVCDRYRIHNGVTRTIRPSLPHPRCVETHESHSNGDRHL